jgi:hypothetical protein
VRRAAFSRSVVLAAVSLSLILNVITVALALAALLAALVTIRDARAGQEDAEEAHQRATDQQAALLLRGQVMQRVVQLRSMGQLVAEVAVVAGREAEDGGEFRHDKDGPALGTLGSALVPLLQRLEFELRIYEELGGEPQPKLRKWVDRMQSPVLPRAKVMDLAQKRLRDLGAAVELEGETLIRLSEVEGSLFRRV